MHKFKLYTSDVYKELKTMLKTVNENVFTSRPIATKTQLDSMLVVSLTSIRDKGYFQYSTLNIKVIVKEKAQGVENIKQLDTLSSKIIEMFPLCSPTGRFKAQSPSLVLKGRDDLGYTIWNIQSRFYINTTDSYK